MTFSAMIGFLMVLVLVVCLVKKKLLPPVAFILLPVLAALACGFGIQDIGKFANSGVRGMVSTVSLFVFSIAFFSLMGEVGVFDAIVGRLTRIAGNSTTAVMLATAAIAVIGHLDGSGATTFIITITAMAPVFKKLNLDKRNLMLITCIAIGVMNVMPWAGPTLRAASVLQMDAAELWHPIIPVQAACLVFLFATTFALSRLQLRKTARDSAAGAALTDPAASAGGEAVSQRLIDPSRKGLMLFNYLLTLGVIATLVVNVLPSVFTFMLALAVGLIANIRDIKIQGEKLKEYGTAAMAMVVTLFAAGIFTGVLKETKMLDSMAAAIVTLVPASIGQYTHILVAVFAVPLIMCLGTDSFYYGLLPVVIGVAENFGVAPVSVAHTLIIAENIGVVVSPLTPAVYLGLGLLDLDIGEHIKYSLPWVWGLSILFTLVAIMIGVAPI